MLGKLPSFGHIFRAFLLFWWFYKNVSCNHKQTEIKITYHQKYHMMPSNVSLLDLCQRASSFPHPFCSSLFHLNKWNRHGLCIPDGPILLWAWLWNIIIEIIIYVLNDYVLYVHFKKHAHKLSHSLTFTNTRTYILTNTHLH